MMHKCKLRIFLFGVVSILASSVSFAQERLTFLDWDIIIKDTLCPTYSEAVPLESDYKQHTYSIELEFPSWAPLDKQELQLAKRNTHLIGKELKIEQYISISKGKGVLNYFFIPIIKEGHEFKKLVSAKVVITATPKTSLYRSQILHKERYAENSVLASGTWKKIHITHDGIYRLSASFLSKMGFSNPDNVHLYGYGGHQQHEVIDADNDFDDLEEVPLFKNSKGDLLFWGNGLIKWNGANRIFNAYAVQATYFLTEGGSREDISTETEYTGSVRQTINTTLAHALHEVDDFAWFRAGRNLVESSLFSGASYKNYSFKDINSTGNEKLTLVFTSNNVSTPLTVTVNDSTLTTTTIPAPGNYMYFSEKKINNLDVSDFKKEDGTWEIRLSTKGSSSVQGRLDYICLNYTSPIEIKDGFIKFGGGYRGTGIGTGNSSQVTRTFSGPTRFSEIKGNTSEIKIMQLGRRGEPTKLIVTEDTEDGLSFTTEEGDRDFVAFNPEYPFPEPKAGASIENQNLHAASEVDMVIIVPASGKLIEQANRLAEAHKTYSGISCLVVKADHIYNEFSSGTPDATAYRRFLKMLYDKARNKGSVAPKYLLLFGDCAWDNRMKSTSWRSFSPNDYLLSYQSENSYSDTHAYCWEDYFGLMDDGEGNEPTRDISDLAIGRFPVTTEAEAKIMVDKTVAHLSRSNAAEWCNRIVVMGDDGDENTHMTEANQVADRIAETAPRLDVRKIMWDNYSLVNQGLYYSYPEIKTIINNYIREGVMFFNYTGHGATYLLSHERVVTLDDMKNWKTDRLPLWFTAACDISPFDSHEENLGEAAVLNKDGGGVAFIGTTHTVYSTQNFYLNRLFSKYLFDTDSDGKRISVGEALRLAKQGMVSNSSDGSQPQNKLQYALLGDPSLIFGNPIPNIILDSINGEAVNGQQQLQGGARIKISGHIENPEGNVVENFNGTLNYRLYDNKNNITTRSNTGNDPFTYTDWDKEINLGIDSIRNGKFETSLIIPKDISYSDENGRLVFYATDNKNKIEANGYNEAFLIGGYSSDADNDTIGPDIFIYLNDKSFADGEAVGSNPTFVAELFDESGIQYNGNGLGHDLQLCIDGDPKKTYNLNSYYTPSASNYKQGLITFNKMPKLEIGAHNLSFRAWDMLNNTSIKTLNFIVGENLKPEIVSLILEEDIITGHTNFHVSYNLPGVECDFSLEIFSISGAMQWRQEFKANDDKGTITIPWPGCNSNGAKLNNGIYICKINASYNGSKNSHKEKKFIFRGNK